MSAMFLAVCSLLLAVLGVVSADEVQTALDGHIYNLNFDDTTKSYEFKYNPIDSKATMVVMVYPNENNTGTVQSKVYATAPCSRFVDEHTDFFTGTYKVHNELDNGDLYDFDLTECTVYVRLVSNSAAKVNLSVTSSIVLVNNYTFTLTDSDETDTYDYAAHNYIRYFMTMNCEKKLNDRVKPSVSVQSPNSKAKIYVNGWGGSSINEPGRPSSSAYTCSNNSKCDISALGDASNPGWVFVAVDVTNVFNVQPTEEEPNPEHTASITFDLEIPVQLQPGNVLDLDLGMYAGCSRLIYFSPSDWATTDEDGDTIPFDLLFEVMTNENFSHDNTGLFYLRLGTNYPLTADNQTHGVADNLMKITDTEINYYSDYDGLYISISMVKGLDFPQPSRIGEVININATMLKDADTISLGRKVTTQTLKRTTGDEGCGVNVDYTRLAFDTVGVNKLGYVNESDANTYGHILCDYVIAATTQSAGITPKLYMGAYIGAAGACVPYRIEPTDETDADNISTDYLIKSRTIEAVKSDENTVDITYLSIPTSSNKYFQDGAYILDVYNTNLDTSTEPEDIKINIAAHPSWNMRRSVQYNLDLGGTSRYDFFVLTLNDLSKGVTFSIEPEMSTSKMITFNIYASFKNSTPDINSRFTKTGYGRADLFISAEDLKELEDEDEYKVYIAVDTMYRGYVIVYYTEGEGIEYNISDGDNVIVPLTTEKPTASINMHSSKFFQAKEMIFYFDASDNDLTDGSVIKACVTSSIIDQIDDCGIGNEVQLKANAEKKLYKITLSGDDIEHTDHFIFIAGIFGSSETTSLKLRVFAEKNTSLEVGEVASIVSPEVAIPLLAYMNTKTNKDYLMNFNLANNDITNAKYTVRVCAEYPSYSLHDPPDVDDNNSRNCLTERLTTGSTLTFDLIGDSLYNDSTLVNDLYFIRSTSKYISIYPNNGIPFSEINIQVFEDEHTNTDDDSKQLKGTPGETTYFRLHVISADSLSSKDMLNFRFTGDNPVDYCISSSPHVEMNENNCIKYHISNDSSEYVSNIDEIVRMTDIDPSYNAKHDAYIYFAFNMPEANDINKLSVYTTFSNVLIHYLDQVMSSSDNIDDKSYYFEMYKDRIMAFYTMNIEKSKPYRFFIIPDVVKNDKDYVSPAYTTSVIGIKKTSTIEKALPEPTESDNDANGAGILIKDYTFADTDFVDGKNYVITVAKFINRNPTIGRYKAGYIAPSDDNAHILHDMVILNINDKLHLSSADASAANPNGGLGSVALYAGFGSSQYAYRVTPCTGFPAVYQSYLNSQPKYAGAFVDTYPAAGYAVGNTFKGEFLDRSRNKINVNTGFVLNATAYIPSIADNPDAYDNLRWDAFIEVISSEDQALSGGPTVPDPKLVLVDKKGSQLTIAVPAAYPHKDASITEYAVYAMPAVSQEKAAVYFDAAPDTYCGVLDYGFPLLVDEKNEKEAQWYSYTVKNDDPNKIGTTLQLTTNYSPDKHTYSDADKKPNYYDPDNDDSLSTEEKNNLKKLYNVNVVVREVVVSSDGKRDIVGYSAYSHLQLEISGDMPVTKGGLFVWEVALIIVAIIIVIVGIVIFIIWLIREKRKRMEYNDVDGQGAYKNEEPVEISG